MFYVILHIYHFTCDKLHFHFLECCSVASTDVTDLSSSITTSSTSSIFCSSAIGDGAHSSRETEQDELIGRLEGLAVSSEAVGGDSGRGARGVIFGDCVGGGVGSISAGSISSTLGDGAHSSRETGQDELIGGLEGLAVSSGAVGGDSGGEDGSSFSGMREVVARKRRTLVGVERKAVGDDEVVFCQAVYNTETKEVLCIKDVDEENVIRVCGLDETSGVVEIKRTMDWTVLRGDEDKLWMMAMDGNNELYGCMERKSDGVERVEILDQNTLEKKEQLDTDGIDNGINISWMVGASGHSVVVAVLDARESDWKWTSVTVFKNQQRQHTVSLNIALDGGWNISSCVLANETTLLLSCGNNTNRVAVISLPPPPPSDTSKKTRTDTTIATTSTALTLRPLSVIYIVLSEVKQVYALVWMPSAGVHSQSQLLTGHLWVTDYHNNQEGKEQEVVIASNGDIILILNTNTFRVYELDIKKDVSQPEQPEEITLHSMTDIAPSMNAGVFCKIDETTIFGDCAETGYCKPCLFSLEYQPPQ